jgi:xanthine dehydrogenase molybdopterin-binding subunit B
VIDTLTGENRLLRVDILHDVGRSLNPAIDLGQIEGGFIQGLGWLTTEELWWDDAGRLRTHAPSTYKIPTANDRPDDMRISIWEGGANRAATIYRSKAVGEPPLMLALSTFSALTDAVAAAGGYRAFPHLDAPGYARAHSAGCRSRAGERCSRKTQTDARLACTFGRSTGARRGSHARPRRGAERLRPSRGRRANAGHRIRPVRHGRRR